MNLITDRDGVDVIISPVFGKDGLQTNLDFNFGKINLYQSENKSKNWDLRLYDGRSLVSRVKFSAFQFPADGVDRRTISLNFIELERPYRGKGKSYDVGNFVLQYVARECDREWGAIISKPVLFIEKKNFTDIPRNEHNNVFQFLKKISEKILGVDPVLQAVPDHDLVVTAIGEDISIQLIEGHLEQSDKLVTNLKSSQDNPN